MSKIFLFVLLVCVTVVVCKKKKAEAERQPGFCLHKKQSIKEGEVFPSQSRKCKAIKCLDAAANTVKNVSCLNKDTAQKCTKIADGERGQPFPACCPKMKCTDAKDAKTNES